jgi:hypothetical protein
VTTRAYPATTATISDRVCDSSTSYQFDPTWGAQSEISYTDNDSNQADSSYHKYQALVSINALF